MTAFLLLNVAGPTPTMPAATVALASNNEKMDILCCTNQNLLNILYIIFVGVAALSLCCLTAVILLLRKRTSVFARACSTYHTRAQVHDNSVNKYNV